MNITLLTNEYPPNVYGGAGVHVEYLARELAALGEERGHRIRVLCFGEQDEEGALRVQGIPAPPQIPSEDPRHGKVLGTLQRDLHMAAQAAGADIVHGHTWYSHMAGMLAQQLHGARLVLTTHSLEPHRPWKAEQLGTAYRTSSWIERLAYGEADGVVAVSQSMRRDVQDLYDVPEDRVEVIHNGIDPDEYRPRPNPDVLREHGVDPEQPYVLFVGRITRQKGILHLVRAIPQLPEGVQAVLLAGAPDTDEIAREMKGAVDAARSEARGPIIWVPEMLPRPDVIAFYTGASVFVCPSVYEPFGIINLEAMACETPVVASKVGGIPEIVVEGETGHLVGFETAADGVEPRDPEAFSRALAEATSRLVQDDAERERMGRQARERVLELFSWRAIAERTMAFYERLVESRLEAR